jgi:hypothetical protein
MANKRISSLDNLGATPATGDILPITDISDPTGSPQGTTKGVTFSDLTNHLATQVSLGNHEALTSAVHGISAFGATLVDDADASAARTTLGLGTAATTASTDYATASHTHAIDDLSDVDTSTVAPTTDDLLKWDGSNFVPGTVTVDVDAPINAGLSKALRGTDNPHIGAYPDQSFKVIDNPKKLVMVIANDSGDLDFLLPDGGSIFLNTPTGGRLAPGFGFSVQEDATEPDIEVLSGGENYSVISGDSDTKGANGLPTRQGFNLPDIGAYPAPLLISGGTIA